MKIQLNYTLFLKYILKLTCVFALVFIHRQGYANDNYYEDVFEKANVEYANGNFNEALKFYNEILDAGFYSPNVYFNVGNTYFKLQRIPESILYFEKALHTDPSHADARFNLAIANQQITDKINAIPEIALQRWFREFLYTFSADTWAWIAVCLFWMAVLTILLYRFSGRLLLQKIYFFNASLFFILFLGSLILGIQLNKVQKQSRFAIVFDTKASVKSEPSQQSTTLFVVHEGLKVRLNEEVNNWFKVELPDGNIGWVQQSAVERIN